MDDIELDNLGEDQPIEFEEEETNTDWRDESVIIIGGFNPEIRQGLDAEKQADRELVKFKALGTVGTRKIKKKPS